MKVAMRLGRPWWGVRSGTRRGQGARPAWQRWPPYERLARKRPWYVAACLPPLLVWAVWFPSVTGLHAWHLFSGRYALVLALLVASTVAGLLLEGTGAVSFPVMTLLFGTAPLVAREFAVLTQAVTLSGAGFALWYQDVPLETNAVIFCSFGGAFGTMFALEWIAPFVPNTEAIMTFVSLWIGFGAATFLLNRERTSTTELAITNCSNWKAFVLLMTGFCGGVISGMFGSGLDLAVFTCLTLLFRISANTAAPTGVTVQMIISLGTVAFKMLFMSGFDHAAVLDWVACLPFVILGAPLGTVCLLFINRTFVSVAIYMVDLCQFIYAIFVLPIDTNVIFLTVVVIVGSTGLFLILTKLGEKLMDAENKGYMFDSDTDEDRYEDLEDGTSLESLPLMEEAPEGAEVDRYDLPRGNHAPA